MWVIWGELYMMTGFVLFKSATDNDSARVTKSESYWYALNFNEKGQKGRQEIMI